MDNFFYYDADKKIYPTLLDALDSGTKCWFYCHDSYFSKIAWTVEPVLSLNELYRLRAQEIRDNYPYVILCYSGGNDSTAMLETFYYNNIHIDEILIVGALSQDPQEGSDMNHNGDLYHNAFPTLAKFNLPNTKITVLDYTKWFRDGMISDFTIVKQFDDSWVKHIGAYQSVHHYFWYDLKKIIGAYNELETAVVFGADKTPVYYRNGRPYVQYDNLSFCDYGQRYHNENFHRVNFYIDESPVCSDIMRKQAHTLLKFDILKGDSGNRVDLMNQLYYDIKNPLKFQSEKTKYTFLSPRDTYILDKKDSELYKIYVAGMKIMKQYDSYSAKKTIQTRPYWLT